MPQTINNMSVTWADAGITFTGIKLNVTDTASNAASLLFDLQVGGSSWFKVDKTGKVTFGSGTEAVELFSRGAEAPNTGVPVFRAARTNSATALDIFPNGTGGSDPTGLAWMHILKQDLAAAPASLKDKWQALTMAARSDSISVASMASSFNITVTGASGNGTQVTFTFATQAAAPFSAGDLITVASVNPSSYNNNFTVVSGTTSSVTVTSTVTASYVSGGAITMRVLPLTIGGDTVTVRNRTAGVAGQDFAVFSAASNVLGGGASDGRVIVWNSTSNGFVLAAAYPLGWESGTSGTIQYAVRDLYLFRDAAGTLAQRNGTNAQTFRVYGTYTDGSNYRRLVSTMSAAGVAEIKPDGAGTGATGNVLHISGLPTSNPGPGILWNNAGTPAIGT